jgi:hypothetical protein
VISAHQCRTCASHRAARAKGAYGGDPESECAQMAAQKKLDHRRNPCIERLVGVRWHQQMSIGAVRADMAARVRNA